MCAWNFYTFDDEMRFTYIEALGLVYAHQEKGDTIEIIEIFGS